MRKVNSKQSVKWFRDVGRRHIAWVMKKVHGWGNPSTQQPYQLITQTSIHSTTQLLNHQTTQPSYLISTKINTQPPNHQTTQQPTTQPPNYTTTHPSTHPPSIYSNAHPPINPTTQSPNHTIIQLPKHRYKYKRHTITQQPNNPSTNHPPTQQPCLSITHPLNYRTTEPHIHSTKQATTEPLNYTPTQPLIHPITEPPNYHAASLSTVTHEIYVGGSIFVNS